MKSLDFIKLTKNNKKMVVFLSLLIIFLFYIIFFDTTFEIYNYTGKKIAYRSHQYIENYTEEDFEKDYDYTKIYFTVDDNSHSTLYLRKKFWYEPDFIYNYVSIRYHTSVLTEENMYDLNDVSFSSKMKHSGLSPSCSFKIEVHPDKTIVTPTNKWFCKKPMYYHTTQF